MIRFRKTSWTSFFVAVIIATATRCRHLARNVNMGLNKLLTDDLFVHFSDEDWLNFQERVRE